MLLKIRVELKGGRSGERKRREEGGPREKVVERRRRSSRESVRIEWMSSGSEGE